MLQDRRELLDRLSDLLMVTEVIDGEELKAYASGDRAIPTPEEARTKQAQNGQAEKPAAPAAPGPDIVLHGQDAGVPPPPPGSLG